ncbi:hypothetical protein D3C73_817220 [compost metagenome]
MNHFGQVVLELLGGVHAVGVIEGHRDLSEGEAVEDLAVLHGQAHEFVDEMEGEVQGEVVDELG